MPPYLERPEAKPEEAVQTIALPYGMTAQGVVKAVNDTYSYLHALNKASIEHGYNRLEDLMQPAGFSGLLSNVFVRSIAKQFATATPGLAINQMGKGRPDLIPRAMYPGDAVHRGDDGVEVKASRSLSGWQGHNAELGWLLVVQFSVDVRTEPVYDRAPTVVNRVMLAELELSDWNYSGRGEGSRRTPTASVNESGFQKLAKGAVYVRAGAPSLRAPRVASAGRRVRKRDSRRGGPPASESPAEPD
jgi:hypothetical protein